MTISRRKLQEIKGSYLVTLPKGWVDNCKLSKGSEVSVQVKNQGSLEIFPEPVEDKEEKKVSIVFDDYVIRRLIRAYFAGNDVISVRLLKPVSKEQMKMFSAFVRKLMNVEIVEETSDRIVLQNFGYKTLDIKQSFKRMYFLVHAMFDDVVNGNFSALGERDELVDKFYLLVVMQVRTYLSKGYYISPDSISLIRALDYRMVSEKMERIGDILKNIEDVRHVDIYRQVFEYFNKAVLCFIADDFEKSCRLDPVYHGLRDKVELELRDVLEYSKDISGLVR